MWSEAIHLDTNRLQALPVTSDWLSTSTCFFGVGPGAHGNGSIGHARPLLGRCRMIAVSRSLGPTGAKSMINSLQRRSCLRGRRWRAAAARNVRVPEKLGSENHRKIRTTVSCAGPSK